MFFIFNFPDVSQATHQAIKAQWSKHENQLECLVVGPVDVLWNKIEINRQTASGKESEAPEDIEDAGWGFVCVEAHHVGTGQEQEHEGHAGKVRMFRSLTTPTLLLILHIANLVLYHLAIFLFYK